MPSNSILLLILLTITSSTLVASEKDQCTSLTQNKADLDSLAMLTLDLASKNASNTREHILIIMKTTSDHFIKQCLTDCFDHYTDAVHQVKVSMEALRKKRYQDIKHWVTAAMTGAQTCEESFQSKRGYNSPLTSHHS
uniref:Pectinesterase inhibitor domain-containing protein n=1 Tax=Kalanchoe fedtschenkoi TaxID=63787 RepID=A0A7N0VNJ3_KALFE